jgi:iron complex outermembrane receptor protein/vitamin B12 transporter
LYETATVRARPVSLATASITVIDRRTIEASGARTVGELMRYVAGAYVVTGGSRGGLSAVQIRGGDPNFTLVLIDGVPANDGTDQLGGAFNLDGLPASGVERVEIVAGPNSYFYGSTALAGVVNVVTRRADDGPPETNLEGEAGDAALRHAAAATSGRLGGGRYRAGLVWDREEGRIGRDRYEGLSLSGGLGRRIGPAKEWRVDTRLAGYDADDYPEGSGGPLLGTGELRSSRHREAGLRAELLIGQRERRQHRFTAKLYGHDVDRTSPGVPPFVPPSEENTRYRRVGTSWTSTWFTGRQVAINAGAEASRERGRNRSALLLDPEVPGDYDLTRTIGAAFAEILAERGRFVLEAASRLDLPEGFRRQLSPRCGVSYRLADGTTRLRGSIGGAFKLPSFYALASPPTLGGNPGLRPETSVGADLGIEHDFEAIRLRTSLSLFQARYRDLIDFDFDTLRLINRAEAISRGAELSAAWRPTPSITVDGIATLNEVEDRATGEPLRQRPRWVCTAVLRWKPDADLSVWVDRQIVSRRLDRQLPVPGRDTVGGYQVMGLSLSWRFAGSWEAYARIDNLIGADYETAIGFPGAERSARLGLRYALRP